MKSLLICSLMMIVGGVLLMLPNGGTLPLPVSPDVLGVSYAADRATQVAILKELAAQPFDGATDDGRRLAGEWFTKARFRNRADDFGAYTDAVAEAIAGNSEADLAKKLEAAQ